MRHNTAQVLRKMLRRGPRTRHELSGAARRIAVVVNRKSKRVLQDRIYSKPIPVGRRSGRPKWRRTGDVKRRETARAEGLDVVLENRSGHAVARHDLGTPRGRRIVSEGVESVQWHSEAIEASRAEI